MNTLLYVSFHDLVRNLVGTSMLTFNPFLILGYKKAPTEWVIVPPYITLPSAHPYRLSLLFEDSCLCLKEM